MRFEGISRVLLGLILLCLCAVVAAPAMAQEDEEADPKLVVIEPLDPPRPWRIIEGDIMVTEDWYQEWLQDQDSRTCWSSNFWPSRTIPFVISGNVDATRDSLARVAMDTWERVCDINFVPRSGQSNYIRIIADSNVNSSFIGPIGGRQDVKITSWFRITICHELFHAMGFYHEQSRPDRNTYVEIIWDNIEEDKEHNFDRHSGAGEWWGRYDFRSIMHYSSCAFDIETCGLSCCTTIAMRPGYEVYQDSIGNRSELSHMDSLTAKFMFSDHTDWSFMAVRMCADYGSYANPYTSWYNAFGLMPVGDTLWALEGPHFPATGVYSKECLIHNALEPTVVGPDESTGIGFGINGQIKMHSGGDIEIF